MRVGLGQDSHPFEEKGGKPLVLGGVAFEGERGFKGNSDADVVLHALCNALCSAVGEASIATYSDAMCERGIIDSKEYVKVALEKVKAKGFTPVNVSFAIECSIPKIEPRREEMKKSIAGIMGVGADEVGVTATSGEGLTAFGRGEGVQVFCVALLKKV